LLDVWRDINFTLQPAIVRASATDRRIEIRGGGVLEMWTMEDENAGRGRKYARVIVDEAAMVSDLADIWSAAIRPTLTDYIGDAWFLSTPRGRNGFFQLYSNGLDPLQPDWACWQMPTSTNPYIAPTEIEAARKELPDRTFKQEYLAEFLEDSAVFRNIVAIATGEPQAYKDHNIGHEYVIGCDWGKTEDYSVFSVVDVTVGELCYQDRSNRIDYLVQIQRLKDLKKRFDPSAIVVETNGNQALMELLRREQLPLREFTTNNSNKEEAIQSLMIAFEQGKLKIIPDPVLVAELQAFEATPLMGGRIRYAAPAGYHDDCVMALALAWTVAKVGAGGGVSIKKRTIVR
jgi:phage FluMu gp28-like protein